MLIFAPKLLQLIAHFDILAQKLRYSNFPAKNLHMQFLTFWHKNSYILSKCYNNFRAKISICAIITILARKLTLSKRDVITIFAPKQVKFFFSKNTKIIKKSILFRFFLFSFWGINYACKVSSSSIFFVILSFIYNIEMIA